MASSILLRRHNAAVAELLRSPPSRLAQTRSMGGGPRTFPGGLNKWQWKRMHEKRAREKEKGLLAQEKQLYHARIRSQIRAGLAGKPDPFAGSSSGLGPGPMSPRDHVKALADRFVKDGAEDLWNSRDGPVESEASALPAEQRRGPVDLRKLVPRDGESVNSSFDNGFRTRNYASLSTISNGCLGRSSENCGKMRSYSSVSKPFPRSFVKDGVESSKLDRKSVGDLGKKKVSFGKRQRRFERNESSGDDSDEDDEEDLGLGELNLRRTGSSASLGKCDVKVMKRRVSVKEYKGDISDQIEVIRHEISRKRLLEEEEKDEFDEESVISQKRFDELEISPLTVKALSLAGYVQMTGVQEAALSVALEGKDALVKAKTGTGKTAAFLVPAIETVLKALSSNTGHRVPPVFVLILCPTRELASQILAEANVLLRFHDGIGVQMLVGGARFKDDQKRLESSPSQIIVATPGRLLDHIEHKSGLSARLMGLHMLILDEAGHLLDLGFRKDIEKIADCLPRQRQTLLFSATVPKEVRRISQLVLKREHKFIDTVGLGNVETVSQVKQSYLVAPHELHFQIVHHLLMGHISQSPDYKVIVFCPTAMVTSLMYLLLHEMKMNVREIHTRKPQLYRSRVSEEFKESKGLILVTSDVSARGMNYPDITLVLQVGIPVSRDQYIHRLGRTGREGKAGEGMLLLAPWEEYFLEDLRDLPIEKFTLRPLDPDEKLKMDGCMAKIDGSVKEAAYHSWLGYYNAIKEIGRDKTTLVEAANRFCESIGLQKPPALFRKTAVKMGLRDVPGIKIKR